MFCGSQGLRDPVYRVTGSRHRDAVIRGIGLQGPKKDAVIRMLGFRVISIGLHSVTRGITTVSEALRSADSGLVQALRPTRCERRREPA